MDLFEEVGEDALGFLAPPCGGEFGGDGAEVIQGAADLDEAVVQLVDGFGVFEGVVVLVGLLVVLRGVRAKWRADRDEQLADEDEFTPVLATWQYIGSGYLNPGDVLLAAASKPRSASLAKPYMTCAADTRRHLTRQRRRSACRRMLVA